MRGQKGGQSAATVSQYISSTCSDGRTYGDSACAARRSAARNSTCFTKQCANHCSTASRRGEDGSRSRLRTSATAGAGSAASRNEAVAMAVAKKEKKSTGSRASSRAAGTCCCVTNCARSAGQ